MSVPDYLKMVDEALAKAGYSAPAPSPPTAEPTAYSVYRVSPAPSLRVGGDPPMRYHKTKNINDINEDSVLVRGGAGRLDYRRRGPSYAVNAVSHQARLEALLAKPPSGVPNQRWVLAITDAEDFLRTWGEQAKALGWTAEELFGLDPVAPLRRYDRMGLIWFLQGCPVVVLTKHTAVIKMPTGNNLTFYRKGAEFPWRRRTSHPTIV